MNQELEEKAAHWCRRALAAESKPPEAPKPAEPTRTERLVRFARDAKALGFGAEVHGDSLFVGDAYRQLDATEAAAVRAALGEGADGI